MVWPALRYVDAPAAIDFLTTVVGFEATVVYASEDDPSVVDHAELRWPLGGGICSGLIVNPLSGLPLSVTAPATSSPTSPIGSSPACPPLARRSSDR